MSSPPRWVPRVFVVAGVGLIALGCLHLAVLPLIRSWFAMEVPDPASLRLPAFLLDHAVAGVLLLPLGWLTIYAARALATGAAWARMVCLTTAGTVFVLPWLVVAFMDLEHLRAWPFALAIGILSGAAALLMIGALAVRVAPESPGSRAARVDQVDRVDSVSD